MALPHGTATWHSPKVLQLETDVIMLSAQKSPTLAGSSLGPTRLSDALEAMERRMAEGELKSGGR